jgi:hypothetical protein
MVPHAVDPMAVRRIGDTALGDFGLDRFHVHGVAAVMETVKRQAWEQRPPTRHEVKIARVENQAFATSTNASAAFDTR